MKRRERIDHKYWLDWSDESGRAIWPPLHRAVAEHDQKEVRRLIEKGADVNESMDRQQYPSMTPLHLAVEENHCEIARLLLEAGARVNAEVSWSGTAMEMALRNSNAEMVRLLLDRGADPNGWRNQRWIRSHMHHVVFSVHLPEAIEIARLLFDHGADITPEMIQWILGSENSSRPREFIATIMDMIAERYPEVVVDYWIENGGDVPGR